jgi:hypothetical protein
MKFVALIALVLSQASAQAMEPPRFYARSMTVSETDARALFSAMRARPLSGSDEYGPFLLKSALIGSLENGYHLSVSCRVFAGGELASCDLVWTTAVELKDGATISFPEAFSQGLVSGLSLLARPQLGQDWSGLDFSTFRLACQKIFSPSDLPVYTACNLSL